METEINNKLEQLQKLLNQAKSKSPAMDNREAFAYYRFQSKLDRGVMLEGVEILYLAMRAELN